MKIYSIRNDFLKYDNIIGYLFYYHRDRSFCVELSEGKDLVDLTLFLAAFAEKGVRTLNPEWSRRWVEQRIVPADRQNLGMILKEAGLKEYDRHRLLVLSGGKCAQDDLSIAPVSYDNLESWAKERLAQRLSMIIPLSGNRMLFALLNKSVYIVELTELMNRSEALKRILGSASSFRQVELISGGSGIRWGEGLYLMADELIEQAEPCAFDSDDLQTVIAGAVTDTAEICERYSISRQYVNRLTKDGVLPVMNLPGRSRFYLWMDVERVIGN